MNYEIKALQVKSTDNIHTLRGKIFIPEGEIKGLFHIVHGMTEHIDRYDNLMAFLAENGYIAFGYDHLGHGKSVSSAEDYGFFAEKDGSYNTLPVSFPGENLSWALNAEGEYAASAVSLGYANDAVGAATFSESRMAENPALVVRELLRL